jgi:hypothetical protein
MRDTSQLHDAMRRFDDALADVETRRIRASQRILPTVPELDPRQLAEVVSRRGAPAELAAVADAVKAGRATWADVAAGRSCGVPEVEALLATGKQRVLAALADPESIPSEDKPVAAPLVDDEDEDLSAVTYLRRR